MAICTICGKENPDGAEYCEDCGAALATAPGASAATSEAPMPGSGPLAATQGEGVMPAADPPFVPEGGATPAAPEGAPPTMGTGTGAIPAPLTNPRLVVKRYGAVTAEEIPLQGDHLVVGRFDPESGPVDIDLSGTPEANQLSRHHAELYREADGRWFVKDLGSTNGVFVKRLDSSLFGPRVIVPTALSPGDEVAFGNARFLFTAD